jgi:hypothetical protein
MLKQALQTGAGNAQAPTDRNDRQAFTPVCFPVPTGEGVGRTPADAEDRSGFSHSEDVRFAGRVEVGDHCAVLSALDRIE